MKWNEILNKIYVAIYDICNAKYWKTKNTTHVIFSAVLRFCFFNGISTFIGYLMPKPSVVLFNP